MITFTTEMKARLLRFLADGMDSDDVADEFGCQPSDVVAIARNHGYPDRDKLGRAATIIETNLANGSVSTPPGIGNASASTHVSVTRTAPATVSSVGDLLRTARQHPSKRIQAAAGQIIDRIDRLRELIAEDQEKNEERRRAAAEREAARAEVKRLEQQLADARAALRPKKSTDPGDPTDDEHPCRAPGCNRSFPRSQARSLHERRSHPDFVAPTKENS